MTELPSGWISVSLSNLALGLRWHAFDNTA